MIIFKCLHFTESNENSSDCPEKVRLVADYFNNKMKEIYYLSRELSLDEAMVLWQGRLVFRQYIKGKCYKYGIKLYFLTEPHELTVKFIIYDGKYSALSGKGHAA